MTVLASAALAACGHSTGGSTAATTTTVDAHAVATYVATVQADVTQAEDKIVTTIDSESNGFGVGAWAAAYHDLAATLRALTPPPSLAAQHRVLLADAINIAREADAVAALPLTMAVRQQRDSRKEALATRRQEFVAKVAQLGS